MGVLNKEKGGDVILQHCFAARKKLGKDTGRLGTWYLGDYENGCDYSVGKRHYGIYQVQNYKNGQVTVRLKFPKTRPVTFGAGEVASREKLAEAVVSWQGLTEEEKESYNKRAIVKKITGYSLFVREYMLS
jgi:hypothetical protein